MTSVNGLAAVVTGAAKGIGEATARALAAGGARVAVLDIDPAGDATATGIQSDGGEALFVQCDVMDEVEINAAAAAVASAFGHVDAVVNNAGVDSHFDPGTMTAAEWDGFFAVDLKAAWLVTRAFLAYLETSSSATVVNVSSVHARLAFAGHFPYAAAKAGLEGLTRSLALELGPRGIRVNAVAPGWTRTRPVQEWLDAQENPAEAEAQVAAVQPLGRIAEPEDIAAVIAFLASRDARAVTGAVFAVDCGLSARAAT